MKQTTAILATMIWLAFSFVSANSHKSPAQTRLSQASPPANFAFAWVKTWGSGMDDAAGHVAVDASGNLYIAGQFTGTVDFDPDPVKTDFHSSNNGSIDAFLSKFDSSGNFLWARTWGGSGRDVAYGVGVDASGNAYVVGPFRYTVDFDPDPLLAEAHTSNADYENNIFLSKFTPAGTFQWVRTWGPSLVTRSFGAEGYNVVISGNYLYVVGDFSGDQTDFNPWGSQDCHINHPPVDPDTPIFFDAFLSKFDLNGNFQWARTWGGEGYDDGPGVAVDGLGDVYVAGMYASTNINFDPAGGDAGKNHPAHDSGSIVDVFLSKFDSTGTFQWVRTWGGQGTEDAMGTIVVDGSDNVYVAGRFASTNCDFDPGAGTDVHSTHNPAPLVNPTLQQKDDALDAFVSKFASDGTFLWARTWGGNASDNAMSLAVDQWGHLYVSGWFSDSLDFDPGAGMENHASNGKFDAFISQFDSSGNFDWVKTWGGGGDDSVVVTLDASGNIYATGKFAGSVDFDPGGGVADRPSSGGSDAFLSKFLFLPHAIYLPVISK
jgi:hypothetical protein